MTPETLLELDRTPQPSGRTNLVGHQWPQPILALIDKVVELHENYMLTDDGELLERLIQAETALTDEKRKYHNNPARYLAEMDEQDEYRDRAEWAYPNFM